MSPVCGDLVGVLAPIRDEAYFLLATKREVNSIPFEILTERYTHTRQERCSVRQIERKEVLVLESAEHIVALP